jgi:hypothetical protein
MGLSSLEYWVAMYVQNISMYCVPCCVCFIAVVTADVQPMAGRAAGVFGLTLVLFMLSLTLFVYILSHLFKSHERVFSFLPPVIQMGSMLPQMIVQIFLMIPALQDAAKTIHTVLSCVFPPYGIMGSIVFMQYQHIQDQIVELEGGTAQSYWSNNQLMVTILAYVVQIPVQFLLLVLIDRVKHRSKVVVETEEQIWEAERSGRGQGQEEKDVDVEAERRRTESTPADALVRGGENCAVFLTYSLEKPSFAKTGSGHTIGKMQTTRNDVLRAGDQSQQPSQGISCACCRVREREEDGRR